MDTKPYKNEYKGTMNTRFRMMVTWAEKRKGNGMGARGEVE